jgi:eukaryotic-like serine/threonine-protein kinase
MIQVGSAVPDFRLPCVEASRAESFEFRSNRDRRGWLCLIFYPRDFSFVCPTELTAFDDRSNEFREADCSLLAVSVDSLETHREWLALSRDRAGVEGLGFPLASDADGRLAKQLGVWNESVELANRGLLLIDPEGILQYSVVHNLHIGRSVDETLRVLRALQTGGLCPAAWNDSSGTLDPERLLAAGRVLGHYRLSEVLGQGSFGTVFSAWDLRLERLVALKVLRRGHERARRALLDEARAAAAIHHPFVCTIHSVEELDHLPVIVMRHVDGGSLADRLRSGPIEPARAIELARKVAEGLAAAHERGIVHGDLKPANILIDSSGEPCIVDFGLSNGRAVVADGARRPEVDEPGSDETILAATGRWQRDASAAGDEASVGTWGEAGTKSFREGSASLIGTPAYMSPEQATGLSPSAASDIFSLGLVLAEMLSGRRLLDERSVVDILEVLRESDLVRRASERLAGRFPKACLSMLRSDPVDRPTARQVSAALVGLS